jgi:hypothetical protein
LLLLHNKRDRNGSWQPAPSFVDIGPSTGNPGTFIDFDCAKIDDTKVVLVGVTTTGDMWYTTRDQSGKWKKFIDVRLESQSNPGLFTKVSCVGIHDNLNPANNNGLHVITLTDTGQLLHNIRDGSGTWQASPPSFHDVNKVAGYPGTFIDFDCGDVFSRDISEVRVIQMHLVGVTGKGDLWYTMRSPTSWSPFGDVKSQASNNPGMLVKVSCVGVGGDLHLVGLV